MIIRKIHRSLTCIAPCPSPWTFDMDISLFKVTRISAKILVSYVAVNSKTAHAPHPQAFDFFEKFWSNSWVLWQSRWSNAPPASASTSVKIPTHQWPFKHFRMHQTIYSKVNIPLSITKISKFSESCLHSIKLFIAESPHLINTGFFKDSQMLQQNNEYRSNDLWTQCTCWMWKELWNPFACVADQHFEMKVKCPTGQAKPQ